MSPEEFGDNNTYQEPQEVVERRMYVVNKDDKNILTKTELMHKAILVGLFLLFLVVCFKINSLDA